MTNRLPSFHLAGWLKNRDLIFILCGLVGMVLFFGPTDNWLWDPSFYYAQIRSPIVDHDLDFRNETQTGGVETRTTETGLQNSPWPIGPGLFWSPFFVLVHVAMSLIRPVYADGFSFPYISIVALASFGYGIAALAVIYKICRYYANRVYSLAAVLLCLFASPFFFYLFRQPFFAHTTGLLAHSAILLIYLVLIQSETLREDSGLLFGVALGLCFLTRWAGLLMVSLPVFYFGEYLLKSIKSRSARDFKHVTWQILLMAACFILTISPQLVMFYRLRNNFLVMPQTGAAFTQTFLPVNLPQVVFQTNRGLLFWFPYTMVGMAGFAFVQPGKVRWLAIINLLSLIMLIGYRKDWVGGGTFGTRYFIEILPFVSIGFVSLMKKFPKGTLWKGLQVGIVLALILHQASLIYAYEHMPVGPAASQYLRGNPLGIRWHVNLWITVASDPRSWLSPRLVMDDDRQSIFTNLISGVRGIYNFRITVTALLLSPLLFYLVLLSYRHLEMKGILVIAISVIAYCLAWAVFLMRVGR